MILRSEEIAPATSLPPAYGVDPAVMKERSRDIAGYTTRIMRQAAREGDELAVMLAGLNELKAGAEPPVDRTGPTARNQAWWYQLQVQTETLQPYKYVASLPKTYDPEGGKQWPLILFLHGSGERGIDLKLVGVNGPARYFNGTREQPFVIISPQCPMGQWWDPVRLRHLLEEIMTNYHIDPDRVYLTGLSMGGFGSWDFATREPERFAALVPICGGGDERDVARIKNLPTWVFHGAKDETVLPDESYRMVGALRDQKGRVKFTLYPEADHNSWTVTYNNPKLYEWMLQQVRNQPAEPPATGPGTQPSE
jgi:predicted peptidase